MDLGTGKDYDDYVVNGSRIRCHLIDIADPGYKYNVFEYQRDFIKVYEDIRQRGVFPIVCGGSGMYVDSIISGYRLFEVPPDDNLRASLEKKSMEELRDILTSYKSLHNTTDIDTKKRVIRAIEIEHYNRNKKAYSPEFPVIKPLVTGIMIDRDIRRKRITDRLHQRLDSGMIGEVEHLISQGVDTDTLIYYGLEYKYITLYLTGKLSYEAMVHDLEIAIHQFAKRQMTWFRGMERKGRKINWIDGNLSIDEKVEQIFQLLSGEKA